MGGKEPLRRVDHVSKHLGGRLVVDGLWMDVGCMPLWPNLRATL